MLILHIRTAFLARQSSLDFADEDLGSDVKQKFELPVLKAVWRQTKPFQSAALADLIEGKKL